MKTFITLILCFLTISSSFAFTYKPKLHILSIGIAQYQDSNLNLKYSDKDAREVAEAFAGQTTLYNVQPVKMLINEQASLKGIRKALKELSLQVNTNDLVVFFYSGHGLENRLVPYDFDIKDDYSTSLVRGELQEMLDRLGCSYYLLLDACYSGSFAKEMKGITVDKSHQMAERLLRGLESTDKAKMVIGSSASDAYSFECESCENGFFAQVILDAFANKAFEDLYQQEITADRDRNGYVSISEFSEYMQDGVRNLTGEAHRRDAKISVQKVYSNVRYNQSLPILKIATGEADDHLPSNERETVQTPVNTVMDSDQDGIADAIDECPYSKGSASNNGCPSMVPGFMQAVKGGKFLMGDQSGEGKMDEKPVHQIGVRDFYISKFEVTVADFQAFVEATGYRTDAERNGGVNVLEGTVWHKKAGINWRFGPNYEPRLKSEYNHPVVFVSWNDAVNYCNWLSKTSGLEPAYEVSKDRVEVNWDANGYRLPTEAEWEYAARNGGQADKFSWGNGQPQGNIADESAKSIFEEWSIWKGYQDGFTYTAPVGTYQPNQLGIHDMSGNVWEWCWDWYAEGYYGTTHGVENPTGPTKGAFRALRGGGWNNRPESLRVAKRLHFDAQMSNSFLGFRIARNK